MVSTRGECLPLCRTFNPEKAEGGAGTWLLDCEEILRDSVRALIRRANEAHAIAVDRSAWALEWPDQATSVVSGIAWTAQARFSDVRWGVIAHVSPRPPAALGRTWRTGKKLTLHPDSNIVLCAGFPGYQGRRSAELCRGMHRTTPGGGGCCALQPRGGPTARGAVEPHYGRRAQARRRARARPCTGAQRGRLCLDEPATPQLGTRRGALRRRARPFGPCCGHTAPLALFWSVCLGIASQANLLCAGRGADGAR